MIDIVNIRRKGVADDVGTVFGRWGMTMKCKMCNTDRIQCPAFNERFPSCGLGFPIEEKARETVFGVVMRYYGCVGSCTKPKTYKEYIKMKLG